MIAVACGMQDDDNESDIDRYYNSYKDHQEMEGMIAMSEFHYINEVVVGVSRVRGRNNNLAKAE